MEQKEMLALLKSQMHMTYAERNEIAVHMNALSERLRQQDAEIEKLVQQRGTMKASSPTMEWISVEDERKPKHLQNYFVAYVFGNGKEYFFREAIYIADKGNGIVDGPHFNDEGVDGMRVTHWMEIPKLPAPPKQKEQTFKDVFFEKFPKARRYSDGTPLSCRAVIFGGKCLLNRPECSGCWNQPYFEEEVEMNA